MATKKAAKKAAKAAKKAAGKNPAVDIAKNTAKGKLKPAKSAEASTVQNMNRTKSLTADQKIDGFIAFMRRHGFNYDPNAIDAVPTALGQIGRVPGPRSDAISLAIQQQGGASNALIDHSHMAQADPKPAHARSSAAAKKAAKKVARATK